MSTKNIAIAMASLSLGLGLPTAYAGAPNVYQCQGDNVALSYSIGSNKTASVNLLLGKSLFTADQTTLTSQATVMGAVKTMALKIVPDVETTSASFIIPSINLGTNALGTVIDKVTFASQLIITTTATPFMTTPYVGVTNRSKYIGITCRAAIL